MTDMDSGQKKEDRLQRKAPKTFQRTIENTVHNQKVTKNSITVGLKLMDISFLDLLGFLKSMVLVLVDVPPLTHTFPLLLLLLLPLHFLGCLARFPLSPFPVIFFSILMPHLDSAKKREDKQKTPKKHPGNTEYNQKVTKSMGNTIAILPSWNWWTYHFLIC